MPTPVWAAVPVGSMVTPFGCTDRVRFRAGNLFRRVAAL
jgi:hypothetical protein